MSKEHLQALKENITDAYRELLAAKESMEIDIQEGYIGID